ncbi:MAG: hypothetical protein KDD15_23955 [Lewinella sp.]|nr:hypothetical protein [Lewinella sp.]
MNFSKLHLTLQLLIAILISLPRRIYRVFCHFPALFTYLNRPALYGIRFRGIARCFLWLGEIPFLLLDLAGLPEWYELVNLWLKPNSRSLTSQELIWAKSLFGEMLPYQRIRIDERARLGPKQYRFCYVSFCVINSWERMPPAILIHELVHVWQFSRYGSPYILRALLAQNTRAGYDYGGIRALQMAREHDLTLEAFNYEQQAAIVEDFFRFQKKGPLRWGRGEDPHDPDTYRYFISALTEIHF